MDRPLRSVHMIGGAAGAAYFPPLCKALAERGHEITAIVARRPGDLPDRLAAAGIPCLAADLALRRPLAARRRPMWLGYPRDAGRLGQATLQVAQTLRRLQPDVVITHQFNATMVGRLAAACARVPLRMAMVSSPFSFEAPLTRWLDRATWGLDHAIIAGSQYVNTLYADSGVAPDRLDVTYYGPDPEVFDPQRVVPGPVRSELGLAASAKLIGHIAHFYAPMSGWAAPRESRGKGVKGQDVVLEAARLVLASRPDAHFVFAGATYGDAAERYHEELVRRAEELGIAGSVSFLGERDDVPALLAALDLAVQPSRTENLGGTLESLIMGVPTVATRVGGMPEAVRHRETGLLVAPDDPAALADAILTLVADPAYARGLAAHGRQAVLAGMTFDHLVDDVDRIVRARYRQRPAGSTATSKAGAPGFRRRPRHPRRR